MRREKKCRDCGVDITGRFGSLCAVCANHQDDDEDETEEQEDEP